MQQLTLEPIARVSGDIYLPGSKSLSNRALLLAALSTDATLLTNLLRSDDITHMLNALAALGVDFDWCSDTELMVYGRGASLVDHDPQQLLELYLGNAGTAMRPLAAVLSFGRGQYLLTGEPRMKERPIGHLTEALTDLGATIEFLEQPGYPPLKITAGVANQNHVTIDGSISSQFLTALLMAAPLMGRQLTIDVKGELVSKPYIEITLAMMARFGVVVENKKFKRFIIKPNQTYQSPSRYHIEGDASSASYFLAAAAIAGDVTVHGVGSDSLQGDKHFASVLECMGAKVTWGTESIRVEQSALHGIDMDMNHIPDAAMTIATTAIFAAGPTCIRNIYNWRVKETDRLTAMATELAKLGVEVEEGEDFIRITPGAALNHAAIDTYNDHRMAMCFSLLAVGGQGVTINDPGCTAKTFPDYFEQLSKICHKKP